MAKTKSEVMSVDFFQAAYKAAKQFAQYHAYTFISGGVSHSFINDDYVKQYLTKCTKGKKFRTPSGLTLVNPDVARHLFSRSFAGSSDARYETNDYLVFVSDLTESIFSLILKYSETIEVFLNEGYSKDGYTKIFDIYIQSIDDDPEEVLRLHLCISDVDINTTKWIGNKKLQKQLNPFPFK